MAFILSWLRTWWSRRAPQQPNEANTTPLGSVTALTTDSPTMSEAWRDVPLTAQDFTTEAVLRAFASMPASLALTHLQSQPDGLTEEDVTRRRRVKGPNVLTIKKPLSWFKLLLTVIPNPFNVLLVALAILNVATSSPNWSGFSILMIMVVISCAVRFHQEYRSSVAVVRLQASVTSLVKVFRRHDNPFERTTMVSEGDLVLGDVVSLSPGQVVPADCLILESSFLRVSQSTWTGESDPVAKLAAFDGEKEGLGLFDLSNVALMGTSVISGSGKALVLRTGDEVYIAAMLKELEKRRKPNTFQRGIRNVTFMLMGFMVVMTAIVLVISMMTTKDWKNAIFFTLSVAVALVPEMLPAIVNANLARGAFLLAKKKAIVKRLDSIQNLGAMTVLCSDKTGTLTKDEITLYKHQDCLGNVSQRVWELATMEAAAQGEHGNNMDAAIRKFQSANGTSMAVTQHEKIATIPFTFERRRSACIVREATGTHMLICKGAYDEVLALCSHVRHGATTSTLGSWGREALFRRTKEANRSGYRVLLVAIKELGMVDVEVEDCIEDIESNMTLIGMLSFLDPPKDDAVDSIARLKERNVEVKVLTGDSLEVAINVCQRLGLVNNADALESEDVQAITGPDLAQLEGTAEFLAVVKTCKLFTKLTPNQKGLVVDSLRKDGHCVGMLGDGINDGIALRRADVGISVNSGAGVAKDCADIILTEKGLHVIADSVVIGRVTHANSIKYIKMVASSNLGNVFSILAASAWLPFTPMTSMQLLVQNLMYDTSQIAIPWDRVDEEDLVQPKRWNSWDLLRFIVVLGPTSSTIDICTFLLGWFYYKIQDAGNVDAVRLFQTHWFLQGLLTQTLIVHLLRTAKIPWVQSRPARVLVAGSVSIMVAGFILPWIPAFQYALSFEQPAASFVGFLAAQLVFYCVEVQVVKMLYVWGFGTWL